MKDINIFQLKEDISEDTKELVTKTLELLEQHHIKNIHIDNFFEYVNMVEEKIWYNNSRNYYIHNIPVESISNDPQIRDNILRSFEPSIEDIVLKEESIAFVKKKLAKCTKVQVMRYIKHHYLNMTKAEIAREENVSEHAIRQSLKCVAGKIKQ